MISVVVYGRNDSHGYNLHRRAALSLNAMAELLQGSDDELIFVDYNTPPELPSFIEAISDTLTRHCLEKLVIMRVPEYLHKKYYASLTPLKALESIARNVGIRRSNPNNRWILSTNTDMIFRPRRDGQSLGEICKDLPDGAYGLPRFELPEAIWEKFDRLKPLSVMEFLKHNARRFHLLEVARSQNYNLFHAPGDFQLFLREHAFLVQGFDERMILTAHQDSNLCQRLSLLNGSMSEQLIHTLEAYHCAHTRVASYTNQGYGVNENSLHNFTTAITSPYLKQESWGLKNETIKSFKIQDSDPYQKAILGSLTTDQAEVYQSNHSEAFMDTSYYSAHVLPFICSTLAPLPNISSITYLGSNSTLVDRLVNALRIMNFEKVTALEPEHVYKSLQNKSTRAQNSIEEHLRNTQVIVLDFGLERNDYPQKLAFWTPSQRIQIGWLIKVFEILSKENKHRFFTDESPLFIIINANSNMFYGLVKSKLNLTVAPFSTHLVHGTLALSTSFSLTRKNFSFKTYLSKLIGLYQWSERQRLFNRAFYCNQLLYRAQPGSYLLNRRISFGRFDFLAVVYQGDWDFDYGFVLKGYDLASFSIEPSTFPRTELCLSLIAKPISEDITVTINEHKCRLSLVRNLNGYAFYQVSLTERDLAFDKPWRFTFQGVQDDKPIALRQMRLYRNHIFARHFYKALDITLFKIERIFLGQLEYWKAVLKKYLF